MRCPVSFCGVEMIKRSDILYVCPDCETQVRLVKEKKRIRVNEYEPNEDPRKKIYEKWEKKDDEEETMKKYIYKCTCGKETIKFFRYSTIKCSDCGRVVGRRKQ